MDETTATFPTTVWTQEAEENSLAQEVARLLAASGRFRSGQLEVLTEAGVVTLRGRVANY